MLQKFERVWSEKKAQNVAHGKKMFCLVIWNISSGRYLSLFIYIHREWIFYTFFKFSHHVSIHVYDKGVHVNAGAVQRNCETFDLHCVWM